MSWVTIQNYVYDVLEWCLDCLHTPLITYGNKSITLFSVFAFVVGAYLFHVIIEVLRGD